MLNYDKLLVSDPKPILLLDESLTVMKANEGALRHLGYKTDELYNREFSGFCIDDQGDFENVVKKISKGKNLSEDIILVRANGTFFRAEIYCKELKLEDERLFLLYIHDITDKKLDKDNLERFTKALATQLKKINKYSFELEKKNEELHEFAYITAHDLKEPVTNMKMLSNMIDLSSISDQPITNLFGLLKKNIERISDTIFSLNDVIKFKKGLRKSKESLVFKEVFMDAIDSLATRVDDLRIDVRSDFSECSTIEYPSLHLKSIVENLISNSIKYRKEEVDLIIEIETRLIEGRHFLFYRDNGIGFDSTKYGKKVFQIFKRITTKGKGSGLGLYMLKSIVESHGGSAEVFSEPGKGTEFKIYLT